MAAKPTYEELKQGVKELEKKEVQLKLIGEKLVEDEQRASNQLDELDHLFSKTPVGLCLMDTDLRFVRVNEKLAEINGKPVSEHIGRTLREVIPEIAKRVESIYHRVIQTGESELGFEVHGTTAAEPNIVKYWLVSYYPVKSADGRVTGVNTVVQDITERKIAEMTLKNSEERLRNFLENLSDAAYEADSYGNITYANKISEKITSLPLKDIIGKSFLPLFTEESKKIATDVYQRTLNGESPEYDLTFINGTICRFKNEPLRDKDGKIIGVYGIARDVTERKQVEKTLMESEKRYRAVVESQTEMICRFLPDGTLTFVNEAYCRYFGKSRKELTGQNLEFLIPEDDRKKVLKNILSLNQNDPIKTHEHRVVNPNGEMCWHRWTNRAIFDDQNELVEFQSVGWDITERVRAEKALKESEKRFRRLVETMNDGIGIQDENGFITYVNNKFCQMLDYKPDEFIGKPVTIFLDDHNSQILKNQTSIRRKGKVKAYEIEWTCKDGRKIQTIMSPQAIFNDNGQFKGSFSVITDISTLKQTEELLRESKERFRNLTEITSDWIWEVDENEFYTYVSPKVRDMLGYEPEEIIGKTPFDLMPPEEADRVTKIFNNISVSQKTFDCLENLNLHKDGHPVVLETSGIPIYSADGEFLGYRGIDRDITKRKRTEELLRKQTHDLDERVKELNCLYGISKIRERPDISFEEMLQEIVDLIPSSWQYPEITCARIIKEGQEYKTKNFKETVWKQTSNIVVHGKRIGILEICYIEEKPESDEGPFLKEERSLISAIAERLGRVTEHKQTEEALRKAHDELENRVEQRTKELEIQKSNLEEANIAMKVLLKKREEDRKDIEYNILTNVRKLIDPYFDKIKKTQLDSQQKAFLNIMESNLQEITSQFARKVSLRELNLTPTEIQIANMIRNGNSSKEIAGIMNVSIRTVDAHRRNIRKKIGLNQKRANLRSYLLSLH